MALNNLLKLINDLTAFDFMKEQETIIINNSERIADLQATQLFTGIDRNGKKTELKDNAPWNFGYRDTTKAIKIEEGQVIDRVTWRNTGALYNSLQATISNGKFTIISKGGPNDEKGKYETMIRRSGENMIGLTESSRFEFAEDVLLPDFKDVLESKTGLKL